MQQVYRIDQTRINNIRNRALFRSAKVMLPTILFVFIIEYFQTAKRNIIESLIPFLFVVIILLLSIRAATKRIIKSYSTLEIVLNDTGVEFKAEMVSFKQILWGNLKIKEKANGIINLDDMTISAFNRNWYGRGRIVVQPEIMDREKLLDELWKRRTHY